MSPATTKVAECPQLPLRWLNVPSYPEVVECHSVNSHTVLIHEYTIYNTMHVLPNIRMLALTKHLI
jgi:hypothetical protein